MIFHYIKFAFRNFRANKTIFIGSLLTLSIGALSVSLLFSYIYNELTMNDFHEREQDIYITVSRASQESQPKIIDASQFFRLDYKDFSEIETFSKVSKYSVKDIVFKTETSTFHPEGVRVDSTFFKLFNFNLKIGDKASILSNPDALIVSERFAKKMFGNKDPIGKVIQIEDVAVSNHTINGVFENPPANSSLIIDFIIPYNRVSLSMSRVSGADFLLTNTSFDLDKFNEKIKDVSKNHVQFKESIVSVVAFKSSYFNENNINFESLFSRYGDKNTIYVLLIIMAVIFIISVINITNLQIINANISSKFLALNMINGAKKKHLISQKLLELVVLSFLSISIITITYQLILPTFNNFTGVPIASSLWKMFLMNTIIVLCLIISSLIYPIINTFKISVVNGLKNQNILEKGIKGKRNIIIAQFAVTIALLISSIVVLKQLDSMLQKDLGFNSDHIIRTQLFYEIPYPEDYFETEEDSLIQVYETKFQQQEQQQETNSQYIKNQLLAHSSIVDISQGFPSLLKPFQSNWKLKDANTDYFNHNSLIVTPGHKKVHDFEVLEGRFFEKDKDKSFDKKLVINEAAKKYWGITNIENTFLVNKNSTEDPKEGYAIIGVIKDFNYEHLSTKPKPLVMQYYEWVDYDFYIRFHENAIDAGLEYVEGLFKQVNPNKTFTYSFLSDEIKQLYDKEKQLSIIYIIFAALALFISAIGLFTIALYDTNRRIKEIGIRKVNGAKTYEVLLMLNKDFSKYVIIAFIIACPIAYLLMYRWLQGFAYKTNMSWWIFVVSGVLVLIIALLTVSSQSYRAATTNPVKSLKAE